MTSLLAALTDNLPKPDGRRVLTLPALKAWFAQLPRTRFAACPRALAGALLLLLAGLLVWTFALGLPPNAGAAVVAADPAQGDAALYKAVASRLADGQSYYAAVVAEHRTRGYPLHPFPTVRLPTLAMLQASIGPALAAGLLAGLSLLAGFALSRRLVADRALQPLTLPIGVLAVLGSIHGIYPACANWHEAWAAVFIVLSFASRTPDRWLASVLLGLVAVCFRELALPYLCVMALAACLELKPREAAAWLTAILGFGALLTIHAHTLAGLVGAEDAASPGWLALNGWPFILAMLGNCSVFAILPMPLVSVLAVLSLVGWFAWPKGIGARGALLMVGYVSAFLIVGRKENAYWGFLWAPLLPLGLALAPAACRDLVLAVRKRPRRRPEEGAV